MKFNQLSKRNASRRNRGNDSAGERTALKKIETKATATAPADGSKSDAQPPLPSTPPPSTPPQRTKTQPARRLLRLLHPAPLRGRGQPADPDDGRDLRCAGPQAGRRRPEGGGGDVPRDVPRGAGQRRGRGPHRRGAAKGGAGCFCCCEQGAMRCERRRE